MPDAYGHPYAPYRLCCRRRQNHPDKHRVAFRDGYYRTWASGDRESKREKRRGARPMEDA